jgi:hypothetical protein
MKTNCTTESQRRLQLLPALALVFTLVWITGCRTAGYKKADAAAWHSEVAAMQVRVASENIETTMAALNDLVNQPEPDAEPQFLRFSETLDQVEDSARSAGKEVDRLWSDGTRYFKVWEKKIETIEDPGTRSMSENRKLQVSNQFYDAIRQYGKAEADLESLINYLNDLRKALSTDLTSGGLAAIQQSLSEANTRAQRVESAWTQAANELEALSTRTASYRVQESR